MKRQSVRRLGKLAILVICVVVCVVVVLEVAPVRRGIGRLLRKAGLITDPPRPEMPPKILPPDRVSARRHVVAALHGAYARKDFEAAALLNSILAQEAFQRSWRVQRAWRTARDPETGLIPKSVKPERPYWRAKDSGADCFPFLLMAALYLGKEDAEVWLETLEREREISGPMPRTILFRPARIKEETPADVIFGASEYAKDGLLAIAERFGRGPWFERLEEVALALIGAAKVKTKAGMICASGAEVNGEMLQVLCRLYWATRRPEYLEMAERIAEAFFGEIMPKNGGLPATDWDFEKGRPVRRLARFGDHGNEIFPGLAELYFLEKLEGRPQAERYREPMKAMLDKALAIGRDERGVWYKEIDPMAPKPKGRGVSDTWGYVMNAYAMFDAAEGSRLYAAEIERTMRAVAGLKSHPWEGGHYDGYADTIECMLYLLPWFDVAECHRWVDDEIEIMFSQQFPSGFVDKLYLEGNFIRTALLYATYKTQGVLAEPWREDVCLGAAWDAEHDQLFLHVSAQEPWQGRLRLDGPRHRTIWGLPFNYPRLNATPEWFVVEPGHLPRAQP